MATKNIYVPLNLANRAITASTIVVSTGDRIRRDQMLVNLKFENAVTPITAPADGWVKFIAVQEGQSVEAGSLLMILDVFDIDDYRLDTTEVNPDTELGDLGRRGVEREGQKQFTEGYAAELFDAPQKEQGHGSINSVRDHPILSERMKEGVPPKMKSQAANNQPAVDNTADEAQRSPELQNQLSNDLKQSLNVTSSPSTAPTPSRG